MKRILYLLLLPLLIGLTACDSDDVDGVPSEIGRFVSHYWPGTAISSCEKTMGGYAVRVKNGPSLVFNSAYKWISISGNGQSLPAVLLFDQLPPALYEYLQDMEATGNVRVISDQAKEVIVTLPALTIHYDKATGDITERYPSTNA